MKIKLYLITTILAIGLGACKKDKKPVTPTPTGNSAPSWSKLNFQGQSSSGIWVLSVTSGGKIFAGLNSGGTGGNAPLFFSTDSGKSWHQADSLHAAHINGNVYCIKQDPVTGTLLMGCNSSQLQGLFTSTDDGANWTNNPNVFAPWDFAFMNNKTYMVIGNGVSPAPPEYMLSSTDDFSGQWTNCTSSPAIISGYRLFADNGVLFMGGVSDPALYRSSNPESHQYARSDTGITFANAGTSYVKRMARIGNYLFTGTTEGIFRSSDGGHNWTQCNLGFTTNVNDIAVVGSDIYIALKDSAVYKSSDNGSTWQAFHKGLSLPVTFYCMTAIGNYLRVGDSKTSIYRVKTK
ncbi:MAG: hypothetical protein JST19_19880 [Bacteroidetes bacterium]|nr:hypothetical protein [Bacteroidota bacterium]